MPHIDTYFSDYFKVTYKAVDRYGAFNVSLVADLPLFIDPFLLFNSRKRAYRKLHDEMIQYLRFLRDKSTGDHVTPGLIDAWYRFPEVKQNWLGFSVGNNRGRGLGRDFAQSLHENLQRIFQSFGAERVTKSSHLEKLCLIRPRIGRDNISDFTTNLIQSFLLEYTEKFATQGIDKSLRRKVRVPRVRFNYKTESWESAQFDLPWYRDDYVILTPKDVLTKDDTWINRTDLVRDFEEIADSVPNHALRDQLNNYFQKALPEDPKQKDRDEAAVSVILRFPELVDYYIKYKEDNGERASAVSARKVADSQQLYVDQFKELGLQLVKKTKFYAIAGNTYEEAHQRLAFLKDAIENKGCHRIFYKNGHPIERETDLHILYRLTWFATPSDLSREVNDGRGPVDFKASRGARDKTLVEFKLASNTQLKRNLLNQTAVYEKASDAKRSIRVIVYFDQYELNRVNDILKDLQLTGSRDVVLIDARSDNKPSGSKA